MKGFENANRVPEPNVYAEISKDLRGIIADMKSVEPKLRRSVFDRMIIGPEVATDVAELMPLFEQIQNVEDTYGREQVAKLSAFYEHEDA